MSYNPNMYMPQSYQPYQTGPAAPMSQPNWMPSYPSANMQQPYDMRIKVKGRRGAEAFWMPTDSHAILFDEDADVMYYKVTDAAGVADVIEFDFSPRTQVPQAAAQQGADYIPRAEFDRLAQTVGDLMANLGVKGASDAE